jgi:hypothetical protein
MRRSYRSLGILIRHGPAINLNLIHNERAGFQIV